MSIYAYKVFVAVAQYESFAGAAAVLNLTPSAISHIIAKLEASMGFSLFIRKRDGVALTSNGELILPRYLEVIQAENLLKQQAAQVCGLSAGTITIGSFNSVAVMWLPDIMREFHEAYPAIEIRVLQGTYDDVLEWVKLQMVELAFVSESFIGNLEMTPLHRDPLLCVTPKGAFPDHKQFLTIDEIRGHSFIMQRDGYSLDIAAFLKDNDIVVAHNFRLVDDGSLAAMVASGFGFCLMPELAFATTSSDVTAYPLQPEHYRTIGLCESSPRSVSPAVAAMKAKIMNYVHRNNLYNIAPDTG